MSNDAHHDPLDFIKGMWGNSGFSLPGMVTPTFDIDELNKRITDLRAVEGWLRMNLSMLQITIQSLEMQSSTLNAVRTMGKMTNEFKAQTPDGAPGSNTDDSVASTFTQAAMFPWNMMQQMQAQMAKETQQAETVVAPSTPTQSAKTEPSLKAASKAAPKTTAKTRKVEERKPASRKTKPQ